MCPGEIVAYESEATEGGLDDSEFRNPGLKSAIPLGLTSLVFLETPISVLLKTWYQAPCSGSKQRSKLKSVRAQYSSNRLQSGPSGVQGKVVHELYYNAW